jgi:hypothetical protein
VHQRTLMSLKLQYNFFYRQSKREPKPSQQLTFNQEVPGSNPGCSPRKSKS